MLLLVTLLCSLLLLLCRTHTQTYNSSTQIAPLQRYALLPSNNCTSQEDIISCSEYKQCVTCSQASNASNASNASCQFGTNTLANCSYPDSLECSGDKSFTEDTPCKYCYQLIRLAVSVQFQDQQPTNLTMGVDYECSNFTNNSTSTCPSVATPPALYLSQCRVFSHVKCLGKRIFFVQRPCSHTSGYKWSTAFILSVLLGGLGIDRFYLLHWPTGLGKLITFGGLGVWTLLDILLIGTGFLKPSDGSLYE